MGYTHDTQMAQYIPPTLFHFVTGTWTMTAGEVADTIAMNRAAADNDPTITIPVMIPGNASSLKGSKLLSIEVDFENKTAAATGITSITWNKVTRGAENGVAVVRAVTKTYTPEDVELVKQDQHKLVVTLTTPEWVGNNVYYLLQVIMDAGATSVQKFLGAVVNYTARV